TVARQLPRSLGVRALPGVCFPRTCRFTKGPWCSVQSEPTVLDAVLADQLLGVGELAPVVHQETAHAGELVVLTRLHLDRQLLVGEVGTGKLERLSAVRLGLVDLAGVLVVPPSLELLDALFALLFVGLAWCVVVRCHVSSPCPLRSRRRSARRLLLSRLLSPVSAPDCAPVRRKMHGPAQLSHGSDTTRRLRHLFPTKPHSSRHRRNGS